MSWHSWYNLIADLLIDSHQCDIMINYVGESNHSKLTYAEYSPTQIQNFTGTIKMPSVHGTNFITVTVLWR